MAGSALLRYLCGPRSIVATYRACGIDHHPLGILSSSVCDGHLTCKSRTESAMEVHGIIHGTEMISIHKVAGGFVW